MGDDVVLEFEGEDARDGGVDLAEGNLATADGLAHPGDHVLRIAEAARAEQEVGSGFDGENGGLGQRVSIADAAHPERVADDDALKVELVAQQAGDDVGRERGGQLRVKLRVKDMRHHHHRHDTLGDQRAVGNEVNGVERRHAAVHVGQRVMRVERGAAEAGEVFEAADHAAFCQPLQVGAAHLRDQRGSRAEGAIRQAGIIRVGQHIDDGHEVDIQPQSLQVLRGAEARIKSNLWIAGRANLLFGRALAGDLAQFIDDATLEIGADE